MKETSEDCCEQEMPVEDGIEENVKPDSPVSKWARLTTLAVGVALASCSVSSVPGSSKPETQVPREKKEASSYSEKDAREIQRLYVGLARRMYMAYYHGEQYRKSGDAKARQSCLKALFEANRFFETMILPKRFRNEKLDSAMRVVKEKTKVKLELLKNNCEFNKSTRFHF